MTSLPHCVPPNSQYCDDRTKRHPFTEDPPRGLSLPTRRAGAAPPSFVAQVYNLIKDIDDDGNGALDLEEFHLLLHRVGVEFVGKPAH